MPRGWWRLIVLLLLPGGCGRIGFDEISASDPRGPRVTAMAINHGAAATGGPRLAVSVTVAGGSPPLVVRIAEAADDGDCEGQQADDGWQPVVGSSLDDDFIVEPSDGVKKLCGWVKDSHDQTSAIAGYGIAGVDSAAIALQSENVPIVEAFAVANPRDGSRVYAAGEPMQITWTVSDAEQLASDPIDLDYTLSSLGDGAWLPLATGAGGPLGDPTRSTGTLELPAPTDQPFIVRIAARDAAGNRGFAATSDPQNVTDWSVYAGTRDRGVGAAGHVAELGSTQNSPGHQFAIDPRTFDVYAVDEDDTLIRLDARTGQTERVIGQGPLNLPDEGTLPDQPMITGDFLVQFGPDHRLYVAILPNDTYRDTPLLSSVFYQIDLETRYCRRYLGGGSQFDETATPSTVFAFPSVSTFDEDGSLYFLTSCTPGVWNAPSPTRLLKATQGPDGRVSAISVVAGTCATGATNGPGPFDPLTFKLGATQPTIGTIAVWDHGRSIYLALYDLQIWKILAGTIYAANVVTASPGSIAYDPIRGSLYAATEGKGIVEYTPSLTGPEGDEPVRTVVTGDGRGRCVDDGVPADRACVHTEFELLPTAHGLYFVEGLGLNEVRAYRIRFVDRAGTLRTYLGAPAFHGDGLDRRLVHGSFVGIHAKHAADPNQAAFPAGVYFVDPSAMVLGHFDPATERATIDWGNQSGAEQTASSGSPIGPDQSLGVPYFGGTLRVLAFDDDGLPWLRYGPIHDIAWLVRLDAARQVVAVQTGTDDWENAADGEDPSALQLWPYGLLSNLVLDHHTAFVLGGFTDIAPAATIRRFDFDARTTTRVMGAAPNHFTADRTTPGTVRTAHLSASCTNNRVACFTQYRSDQDRLYFTEDRSVRYVQQPEAVGASTLVTLWTHPSLDLNNFIFRADGSQIFYLASGQLHCHDLSSGRPWCDDGVLGPPAVLDQIGSEPNQLTWKDDGTLLVSNGRGQILAYTLPP